MTTLHAVPSELRGIRTDSGCRYARMALCWADQRFTVGGSSVLRQEIALLENFAAQAVIAMENARLLERNPPTPGGTPRHLREHGRRRGDVRRDPAPGGWNRKFQDILDLPDDLLAQHRTFAEYIRFLAERGDFGAASTRRSRYAAFASTDNIGYERTRPDGRVIEIRHNPVPDGGFVLIFSDITERKRNEAEIRAARDAAEGSRTAS